MSLRSFSFLMLCGVALLSILAGCARGGTNNPVPTATTVALPTFTPTPIVVDLAVESSPTPGVEAADSSAPAEATGAVLDTPIAAITETVAMADSGFVSTTAELTVTTEESSFVLVPTATPEDVATAQPRAEALAASATPQAVVSGEIVNVRRGPGTNYPVVGAAARGETFTVTGRNDAGDWWQICCIGQEPGWLYGPLTDVQGGDAVALVTDIPPAPTALPAPVADDVSSEPTPAAPAPASSEPETPAEVSPPVAASGTAGNFDPAAQYHVVGYRIIGYGENNGGIFNNGGQHMIFINVRDAAGNGVDGAVVKNAINDNVNIVTGAKGPGRAEFEMFWDPYKLYVASDPSGPVTSQVTNQMNTAYPHIPDIIGRLGPPEEEYAICPTPDDRCEPPFYHAHWSYEVTFQKVN